MNIFKFLTARTGAVNKAGLAGVVLAGGLAVYNLTGYMADTPAAQEGEIRSLAQVMSSGGQMPSEYSGINISRGGAEFASAADISAQNDRMFDGGEGSINAMSSALDGISARRSALSAGEDGLGMGANGAVRRDGQAAATGGVSVPGEKGMREGLRQANEEAAGKDGASGGPVLQRASVAKAGGSNLGTGGNGGFGAPSRSNGGSASAVSAERSSRAGDFGGFSGAMPEGSTLVASNSTLRGATSTSSSFRPGNMNAHIGRGRFSEEGKDLRLIAVSSAKVAANASRSDNEAAQVFMGGERLAGGVQALGENMETLGTAATADFVDEMDTNTDNFDAAADEIDNSEQERKNHRTRLQKGLFGTLFVTIAAMWSISSLVGAKSGDRGVAWWKWVAAAAVAAVAIAIVSVFIADAAKYIDKYGGDGWSIASVVMGALMLVAIGISFAAPVQQFVTKIFGKLKGFGLTLVGGLIGTGVTYGVESTIESLKSFGADGETGDGLSSDSSEKK